MKKPTEIVTVIAYPKLASNRNRNRAATDSNRHMQDYTNVRPRPGGFPFCLTCSNHMRNVIVIESEETFEEIERYNISPPI